MRIPWTKGVMIASTGRDGSRKVICVDIAIPKQPEDEADMHVLALQDEVTHITGYMNDQREGDMDGKITDWVKGAGRRAAEAAKKAITKTKDAITKTRAPPDPHQMVVTLPKEYLDRMDKIITALTDLLIVVTGNSPTPGKQDTAPPPENPNDENSGPPGPSEGAARLYIVRTG